MSNYRYNDYYLVNDEDVDIDDSIQFANEKRCTPIKVMIIFLIVFAILAVVAFLLIFVIFPLVFMGSISLQQNLVFTHWKLPSQRDYFENFRFPGLKNHYVTVKDLYIDQELSLGLWHMLPLELTEISLKDESYDFNAALKNSNYSVLLYFHGTGEDRSQSERKYQLLRYFFHVIAFDYRNYADSTKGQLLEANVINDCIQIYQWLQNRTHSQIYVWGHSLGTALATSTIAQFQGAHNSTAGLILEAPFTTFREELYHHPIVKYFKWLPWFEATVVKPLGMHGFVFNTSRYILDVDCPIMFLHARDDEIVPYYMSEKLYKISGDRSIDEKIKNKTTLVLFGEELGLNHYFIYQDPYLIFYVYEFLKKSSNNKVNIFEGSHQS